MIQAIFLNGLIRCLMGSINGFLWNFEGFISLSVVLLGIHYYIQIRCKKIDTNNISNLTNLLSVGRNKDLDPLDNYACLFLTALINFLLYF